MTFEEIAAKFRGPAITIKRGVKKFCPLHDDHHQSLDLVRGDKGTLVTCRAGCDKRQVLAAVGLTFKDLFYDAQARRNGGGPEIVATYDYTDEAGQVVHQTVRQRRPDGSKAFFQRRPDRRGGWITGLGDVTPLLYRLPSLIGQSMVVVVEGEKNSDDVAALGIPATTSPMGALAFRESYADALVQCGARYVAILRDHDAPGRTYSADWAAALRARGVDVREILLPGLGEHEDVSDWLARGGTREALKEIIGEAFAAEPVSDDERGLFGEAAEPDETEEKEEDEEASEAAPYTFTPAVPPGHFLADFIAYAADRTDAAHEYHEAVGLFLLAAALPGVKAHLRQFAAGLAANLYLLLIGPSTISRRSTSASYGLDLLKAVLPDALMPDLTTPEAFLEQLAARSGRSAAWYIDEMTDLIEKFTNAKFMTGLRSGLLQAYDGRDFQYARHSKRKKDGSRDEDVDWIRDPHLNVLGNATDSLFKILTLRDLTSGFLPRFGVVMPTRKPRRRAFEEAPATLDATRTHLATRLHDLWLWAHSARRRVTFAPGALATLDQAAARMERATTDLPEAERIMLRRADARLLKLAMLTAAGRLDLEREDLLITAPDVTAAVTIAERWRADAIAFAARVGESDFERHVTRCLDLLARKKGRLPRRVIAQHLHIEKHVLDRVGATLADRGEITIEAKHHGGRGDEQAPETWVLRGKS